MQMSNEVKIPFEMIVDIVKNLNDDLKEELFNRVFLEFDTSPLTNKEKNCLKEAIKEYNMGETVTWQNGE